MGFFYQALKKATGVATETEAPEESVQAEAALGQSSGYQAQEAAAAVRAPKRRRKLDLRFPMESLVSFLSPPIEDQNILAMEQCRVLRARIWETMHGKNMRSLLVTSAMPADGKTLLSVNLAFALSQIENARVLLVDVDMRRPSVSKFLNIVPDKGISTFLQNGDSFDDV